MTTDLTTRHTVTIDAPPERVWEAITTPETIKKWFFGVDTKTDWKEGSPIVHTGQWQGKPYEDKGEIVKVEPSKLLVHTHWSDASGVPDRPENYQRVSWKLSPSHGSTELTVDEVNLPSEEAKKMSDQSWKTVLDKLKGLLER